MKFIDAYNSVIPSSFKRHNSRGFSSSQSKGLIELGDLLDNNLEANISKQEAGLPFSSLIESQMSNTLRKSTSGSKLIKIIEQALDIENTPWITNWLTAKTIANALLPPPAGPGFPSNLQYSAPPPSSPATGGTGQPIPSGSLFISDFNSKTNKLGEAKYIGLAIKKQITFFYNKWSKTGPKPYLPIFS